MARRHARTRRAREPVIALINVVFLLLVFFLIAGSLRPPLPLRLVDVEASPAVAAPTSDALVLHADGRLTRHGGAIDLAAHVAAVGPSIRLVPDRAVPAERLIDIAADLRAAGAERIVIVTERSAR